MKDFLLAPRSQWLILAAIFLVVFFAHVFSPIVTSFDSRWSIYTAVSIIEQGNTDLDEYKTQIEAQNFYAIRIINGHYYCMYPVGVSVIAIPLVYFFDRGSSLILKIAPYTEKYFKKDSQNLSWWRLDAPYVIAHFGFIEKFIASIIVAITAVFIYLISRLYLGRRYSLLVVFIFAFGTSAWSTASRALWQHGPSMLILAITLYLILSARKNPRLIQYASIPLALSYTVRPTNIISIILLTIFVLIQYRQYFLRYVLWALPIAILFFFYNLTVLHSFLPEYYLPQSTMSYNYTPKTAVFYETLAGNLISPNRGLFIFSPILLFSIYGVFLKIKNKQMYKLDYFLIVIMFLHWIVISTIPMWGGQYGPRLFTDIIPYLIYFLIPVVAQFSTFFPAKNQRQQLHKISKLRRIGRLGLVSVFICFLIISFLIHFRGATSWSPYLWDSQPVPLQEKPSRIWDWHDLQFLHGITPEFIEWQGGFSTLEGTTEHNWRWCSQQGTLVLNNTSHKTKKFVINATFFTGYPELSDLNITSTLFTENLKINSSGYNYQKEITIPPGRYVIIFSCDAKRLDAPKDPRYLVFNITNFHIVESNLKD
jgi:hypothetical protein